MEVHTHTHTERKKWTHYFWEFFMLFLAVTLGFFVENQREHFVEGKRAREYASLLLEDLVEDTSYFNQLFAQKTFKIIQADSLLTILYSSQFQNNNYRVGYHFYHVGNLTDFKPAFPVNFEQIKNSGSLRYFKNKKLVSDLSRLNRQSASTVEVFEAHNQFILQNLTPFSINNLNLQQFDIMKGQVLVPVPEIYNWNKREAIILANKVKLVKMYDLFIANFFIKDVKEKAKELIEEIKKEYHLE